MPVWTIIAFHLTPLQLVTDCLPLLLLSTPPLYRKMLEGSNNRFYAHRPIVSPHLNGIWARWLTGGPLHSTSRCPTSTGAVQKSVTFSCVFMLVLLNKCVAVCGSDLQRGQVVMCVCLRQFCLNMSVVGDICLF